MTENRPMSPNGHIKARARFLSLRYVWRLFAAALALFAIQFVLVQAISVGDWILFGNKTLVRIGEMDLSVSYEILALLGQLPLAPLELGVCAFFLRGSRGDPGSFGSIFRWYAKGEKLQIAVKYALGKAAFQVVTFPIGVLPIYTMRNEMNGALAEASKAGLFTDQLAIDPKTTYMMLILLAIYGLVSLPFVALPYMLCDLGKHGFFKCVKYSAKILFATLPQFLLLLVSFLPLILASSCLFMLIPFALVYCRMATICFFDYYRSNMTREPFFKNYVRREGE